MDSGDIGAEQRQHRRAAPHARHVCKLRLYNLLFWQAILIATLKRLFFRGRKRQAEQDDARK